MTKEIHTTLYGHMRLRNSVNGNPRFDLFTADGRFRTQSDAACNYEVENITRSTDRYPNDKQADVILKLTRADRVWDIQDGPFDD